MKNVMEYKVALLTCVLLFFAQIFVSGCSTKEVARPTSTNEELQTQGAEIVKTKPLIEGVEIPREFFDELYPDYSRGITIVLTLPKNSETLSKAQINEIKELFKQSKAAGALHQVSIFAWGSDKENLKQSAALNLEKVRAVIAPHLTTAPVLVSTYNMEDVPTWASRLLMSKEARMKAYFSKIQKAKMFSKVIIGVSTTDQKTFVHPEMVSL